VLSRLGLVLERFFARLVDRIASLSAGDRFMARFFAYLVSPFQRLVDTLDRLGGRSPEKVVDPVAEERKLNTALRRQQLEAERLKELQRSWVSRLGRAFLSPIQGFSDFVWAFVSSRPAGILIWSLPLVAILAVLTVAVYQSQVLDRSLVAARYEVALSDAIRAGETEQADLFRLKLEQLGVRTDRGAYRAALAEAEAGNLSAAYRQMSSIAPFEEPGFPAAHFWIAQNAIDGQLDLQPPESLHVALRHLEHMRTRMGNQSEIYFLQGLAHYHLQQFPAAIDALSRITTRLPAATALLMELHQRNGAPQLAREQAVALHRQLQQMVTEGEVLTEDQFRWQAAATELIGDTQLAQTAVNQWYRRNPDSPDARLYQGTTLLLQLDRWLQRPDPGEVETAVEHFVEASRLIPESRYVLIWQRAARIEQLRNQVPAVKQLYQATLASEDVSGIVLEFFGTAAATREDWGLADQLYERATRAAPEWSRTWNNWAYVLNTAFPQRRQEALTLADRALALDPDNPDYYETRGMIYFNLQQYELAIADLEVAINGVNDLDAVAQALADSHRQLGNIAVANLYQSQVKRRR